MAEKLTKATPILRVSREHRRLLRIMAATFDVGMTEMAERAIDDEWKLCRGKVPVLTAEVKK